MNVRTLLFAAGAAAVLAACGGGGSVPKPSAQGASGIAPYQGPSSLASFTWGKNQLDGAQLVRTIDSGTFSLSVFVNQRNARGLLTYAREVSDPHSANYRHFLTPQEIADRFGASQTDYQRAAQYLENAGLHVGGWPQRQMLFVSGDVPSLQRAFGTTFAIWEKDGKSFIAPAQTPHLSSAAPIAAVSQMVRDPHALRSYAIPGQPTNGIGGYSPQQVARAFDYTGPYSRGITGNGITVAIIGTGPIDPQDAVLFREHFGVSMAPITQVDATDQGVSTGLSYSSPSPLPSGEPQYSFSSGLQTPPPVTAPCGQPYPGFASAACNPEDGEAQLDTQQVASLAPGANVDFYLAYNPNDCYYTFGSAQNQNPCPPGAGQPAEGILLTDAEIQQVIADDKADVVSMSFGGGEPCYGYGSEYDATGLGFGPAEMATMVAEGMAVFASSGDSAAYTCGFGPPTVSYPASDLSVTAVGGVTALINDDGTLASQPTVWGAQTWAGVNPFDPRVPEGSGGGLSAYFVTPPWQSAIGSQLQGYRGVPDLSLLGDPATGVAVTMNASYGQPNWMAEFGGTSVAAPQMAAMWALVLQSCKQDAVCASKGGGSYPYRLGNPAPLLYAVYANSKQYASVFDDVTFGNNGTPKSGGNPGYFAGPGYDLASGLGVPNAGHLIGAIVTQEGGADPQIP